MHGQGPTSFVGPPDGSNGSPKRNRKPYTSTKPREKWTQQEHELFVEALRLHGRQWSKVEEHIGESFISQQDVWSAIAESRMFSSLSRRLQDGSADTLTRTEILCQAGEGW